VAKQGAIELVVVGHATIDHVDGEIRPGGAVIYAALTARKLGVRVGVVTSFAPDYPFVDLLSKIPTRVVEAISTTEMVNAYHDAIRYQRIKAMAATIRHRHLEGIRLCDDAAVLYCPVVHEITPPFTSLAPKGLCGAAPQGLFRRWDDDGNVATRQWPDARKALRSVDVVCMSERDTNVPEELAEDFPGRAFVITKGDAGCRVYSGVDTYDFPAVEANEVDPTGAGDVFATAFLVSLRAGQPVSQAARIASREAAASVERHGIEALL
jgi:sugar/nucleoside kinase (ribokinase family)